MRWAATRLAMAMLSGSRNAYNAPATKASTKKNEVVLVKRMVILQKFWLVEYQSLVSKARHNAT